MPRIKQDWAKNTRGHKLYRGLVIRLPDNSIHRVAQVNDSGATIESVARPRRTVHDAPRGKVISFDGARITSRISAHSEIEVLTANKEVWEL